MPPLFRYQKINPHRVSRTRQGIFLRTPGVSYPATQHTNQLASTGFQAQLSSIANVQFILSSWPGISPLSRARFCHAHTARCAETGAAVGRCTPQRSPSNPSGLSRPLRPFHPSPERTTDCPQEPRLVAGSSPACVTGFSRASHSTSAALQCVARLGMTTHSHAGDALGRRAEQQVELVALPPQPALLAWQIQRHRPLARASSPQLPPASSIRGSSCVIAAIWNTKRKSGHYSLGEWPCRAGLRVQKGIRVAAKRWVHSWVHWKITIPKMTRIQYHRRQFDSAPGHHSSFLQIERSQRR
jgi:hypothetical protein